MEGRRRQWGRSDAVAGVGEGEDGGRRDRGGSIGRSPRGAWIRRWGINEERDGGFSPF
jgi:hypothetical protein